MNEITKRKKDYEVERLEEYKRRLKTKLREMFQIDDASDLDFGIYRIIHQRRKEVEDFIEKDLIEAVDEVFAEFSDDAAASFEQEKADLESRIRDEIDENALTKDGIAPEFLNSKRARDLDEKYKQLIFRYSEAELNDQHRAEIFAHITEFFSRYYKDGDFMSLPRHSRQKKYDIPYNGEEVLLHWTNKDQYYIKTDRLLNNYAFDVGSNYKVAFEIVRAETLVNPTKDTTSYFILKSEKEAVTYDQDTTYLTVRFEYRPLSSSELDSFLPEGADKKKPSKEDIVTGVTNGILSIVPDTSLVTALSKPKNPDDERSLLWRHVARFTAENTSDYFIHKDLKSFLTRELDFYIKNEVFQLDDLGTDNEQAIEQYVKRAKVIKKICLKVIEFLAQMEEFQKILFEKKKFVLSTDYCITTDNVPKEFWDEILQNSSQINEWKKLFRIGSFDQKLIFSDFNLEFLENHPYLMIDTKFFDITFKEKLLSTFYDIDKTISGLLIQSDNYHALNLLDNKYNQKIKCICIDPPYNTGNDEFIYRDSYKHSCWLSMVYPRISRGINLLSENGVFFSNIDDNEIFKYQMLLSEIFGIENFLATFVWQKRYSPPPDTTDIGYIHENILSFKRSNKFVKNLLPFTPDQVNRYKNPDNDPRGPWKPMDYTCRFSSTERPNLYYPIINPNTGDEILPKKSRVWAFSYEIHKQNEKEKKIWWGQDGRNLTPAYKNFFEKIKQGSVPLTLLLHEEVGHTDEAAKEIRNLFPNFKFTNKPVRLIKYLLKISLDNNEIVMDYFAGSGTTAHAVLSLNKEEGKCQKYILIEMADHFNAVMLPRIKKICYSDNWKDGIPQDTNGQSHMFKYQTLEQYEDTLDNIEFLQDGTYKTTLFGFSDYALKYMLDYETRDSPCRLNTSSLIHPFSYTLKIRRKTGTEDVVVDLVETFNYLIGLHVKRMVPYDENGVHYRIVHGVTRDDIYTTIIWRDCPDDLDLTADEKFINETILKEFPAKKVYINAKFFVKGAEPIEPEFKQRMGA